VVEEGLANPLHSFAGFLSAALAGEDHMDFSMFVPLLIFIFVAVGLGAIPGTLAKRKHRS
jgi:hypothetical protein